MNSTQGPQSPPLDMVHTFPYSRNASHDGGSSDSRIDKSRGAAIELNTSACTEEETGQTDAGVDPDPDPEPVSTHNRAFISLMNPNNSLSRMYPRRPVLEWKKVQIKTALQLICVSFGMTGMAPRRILIGVGISGGKGYIRGVGKLWMGFY